MRHAVLASLLPAFLACGVAQDVHQKALDDAKAKAGELETCQAELAKNKVMLETAQGVVESGSKDVVSLKRKARRGELLRYYNLIALSIRVAQAESYGKSGEVSAKAVAEAIDMLTKLRDEPNTEETEPEINGFVKKGLPPVLEDLNKARTALTSAFMSPSKPDGKALAAARTALSSAASVVESAKTPLALTLESAP